MHAMQPIEATPRNWSAHGFDNLCGLQVNPDDSQRRLGADRPRGLPSRYKQ